MNDSGFLLTYPVFLIGRYTAAACEADPTLQQFWATTEANSQRALMVFTEPIFAERLMIAEAIAANVVPVESPAVLADVIERNRNGFTMVLIDPNVTTGIGRGFPVDEFVTGLK